MKVLIATALSVVVSLLIPNLASSDTPRSTDALQHGLRVAVQQARQQQWLGSKIAEFRQTTWSCQDQLGVKRTKAETWVWDLPASTPYRSWVRDQWLMRKNECTTILSTRTIPTANDWQVAVALVQRIYPGTRDWLLYISHREGGHGGFVMNHQGSGAGGWMQFMSGTYYAYSDDAFSDARRRGFIVQSGWNDWHHPLGQALTAAYMRYTGRDGCHWCL